MIDIIIPEKLPTINSLYWHRGNMKIMKKEAKELRERIIKIVKDKYVIIPVKEEKLSVDVEIYENWLTKDGRVKKKDVANREKFLTDSVFQAIGIDDKFIYEYNIKKVQSETEEKAVVRIIKLGGDSNA